MEFLRVLYKKTTKILNNISFLGVVVCIVAIFIGVYGYKDYQSKESFINAKYNYFYSIGDLSIAEELADARAPHLQALREDDPKSRQTLAQEAAMKQSAVMQEVEYQKKMLEQQKKEELDNRLFDLITYISFAISVLIYGISLFWRKKDVNDSKIFQESVLNELNMQHINIEQIVKMQNEQNQKLNSLQTQPVRKGKKKKSRKITN
ncbi:hypothetical protein ABKP09_13585 [Peribacillus frigoritolerans]|uniref:hypothetical protein n=1 Tax=Peribacillus frigoritolerans TaxID=450367 RepID=UPI0032B5BFC5